MPNAVELVKKAAVEAVEASKPVQIRFGTVAAADPLEIKIDQKTPLFAGNLIITQTVSENALSAGEKVILLRMQGGKKYIVLDRLG